jgi:UDPglucose 6-dehydrogenase
MRERIGIVGLWHLGCVLSASWAELGHTVVGFDYDKDRIAGLQNGKPPLYEPGLPEMITKNMAGGTLSYSNDLQSLKECDFVFLSYDTPVRDDDSSDTTILWTTVNDLAGVMKNGAILVVSSQSPAGYCRELRALMHEKNPSLEIAYSPENLRLGEAIACYLNPGRVILGTATEAAEKACLKLFQEIPGEVLAMSLESAETVKHGINSFLSNSIVFANHLADICEAKGARIDDVIRGMKSDPRIGQKAYLAPGIGFSGGTLGRDLKVLEKINNEMNGYAKLFGDIHAMNGERKYSIVGKIKKMLGDLAGKRIGVLGVTYKPGTSTLRRSLPLEIVDLLLAENASIQVFDPKADYSELKQAPEFTVCNSVDAAADQADVLVLMTEWKEFKDTDWPAVIKKMKGTKFFDTKNFLSEDAMNKAGFSYHSIGR